MYYILQFLLKIKKKYFKKYNWAGNPHFLVKRINIGTFLLTDKVFSKK